MGPNEVRAQRMSGLSGVHPWEFFCADQFLKTYTTSDAEIISGLVDKSQDGGIDHPNLREP
jgi:hypothetical protein